MKKSILLLLSFWLAISPIYIIADVDNRKKNDDEEESESRKGVAGTINRSSELIIGTACLIITMLLAPQALESLKSAYSSSGGLSWFLKKDTWTGLFDGKIDSKEREVGLAYMQAMGWSMGTIFVGGYGLKNILKGVGIVKK